jgi:hypothetical protein
MNQLEQFFKRSNFNDLKPFSCASCGAGYGSAKALKKHMSEKHDIKLVGKKGRKPIGERSEETQQGEHSENSDSENEPKVQKAKVPKEPKPKQVKGIPLGIPVERPVEIPAEIPSEIPVETPLEIPAEIPSEIPVDPLDDIVISNSHLRTF